MAAVGPDGRRNLDRFNSGAYLKNAQEVEQQQVAALASFFGVARDQMGSVAEYAEVLPDLGTTDGMKAYRKMSAAYAGKGGIVAAVFEKGRAKGFEEGRVEGRRDREQKLGADGRPALDAGGPPSKQTLTAG